MTVINRRQVLTAGAAALAGAALPRNLFGARAAGLESPVLETRRSPGLVEARLESVLKPLTVAGKPVSLMTYNGLVPGPVLRVREGDAVRLTYTNRLAQASNLHLHGLRISPQVDLPLLEVAPGDSHVYAFELPKGSSGTHWYHPHVHGNVAAQMAAGLSGAMIVSGPMDAMPELVAAEEHLLVLKDLALQGNVAKPHDNMDWMNGQEGALKLVNGQLKPTLRAEKATLRLRLVNASNARYYRLKLEDHPLYLIATNGGFVEKPVTLEELLLTPGERAEVMVQLTREGSFKLQNLPYARGTMVMGGMNGMSGMGGMNMGGSSTSDADAAPATLLTVVAPSNPKPTPLPTGFASLERLDVGAAVATRRITFGEQMMQAQFFFNKKSFDPKRIDFSGRRGTLEVWELHNTSDMDHPFHLHSYPFQIIDRNGVNEPYRAWKDVVNLKKNDLVRIAVPLRDFTGLTVYHCHIVEHEDRGMMGTLEVRA
jgi:FtsP/CotA-like multicopper oxidase with cupredoxin domain